MIPCQRQSAKYCGHVGRGVGVLPLRSQGMACATGTVMQPMLPGLAMSWSAELRDLLPQLPRGKRLGDTPDMGSPPLTASLTER